MINGVMHIVAAVLFAVISIKEGTSIIWMGIAGIYLITGIVNLAIHGLKIRKMEKAAKKAEQNAQKTVEKNKEADVTAGG